MGEKSTQKRLYILETARKVFVEKGFRTVTMKDIVEACDISRGGLYLYFGSTEEIFREVLKLDMTESDDVFSDSITEESTAADILMFFLREQKKELLKKGNTLTQAIYEYYFAHRPIRKKDNVLKSQFDSAVIIIQKLIETGVENGEFVCEDSVTMARTIMYLLEGLKISTQTIGISSEAVDQQLLFIMKTLTGEE